MADAIRNPDNVEPITDHVTGVTTWRRIRRCTAPRAFRPTPDAPAGDEWTWYDRHLNNYWIGRDRARAGLGPIRRTS